MRFILGISLFIMSTMVLSGQDKIMIAKTFLSQNNQIKSNNLLVSSSHFSKQSGLTHIYFNQTENGIKIYNAVTNVAVAENGEVINIGDRFVKHKSAVDPNHKIDLETALRSVAVHFGFKLEDETEILTQRNVPSKETELNNTSLSYRHINASLIYVERDGRLILCWGIEFEKKDDSFWWDIKINAEDGSLVNKTSWTVECNFDHDEDSCQHSDPHVSTDHLKSDYFYDINERKISGHVADGDYTVIAMPYESPSHGPISVVNSPWNDNLIQAAHPFDWHNDGTTTHQTTRGNNVWAVEDVNADNNQSSGFSPNSQLGSSGQEYNFIPDLTDIPANYQEAAITNLFYWNNIVHDVMYHYGFDEDSGNFQETNNTGVSGASDAVQADAQDGEGTNNANFGTPRDGINPRMQMFEWTQQSAASTTFSVLTPFVSNYLAVAASFGPNATFSGTVIEVNDNTGGTHEACTVNTIANGSAISGNIALIDRGNCTFVEKVTNAENEGAIAVVICNNVAGGPVGMSGTGTNIPTVMISQSDCATLRANLPATIDVATGVSPPNRDSDYDNGVIVHEYGHGISNRLTGGKLNSGCLNNPEQMGEGWSDYFGLILTMKPGDTGPQRRGVGTYLRSQANTGNGIRQFPYSTNFAVNPMTYQSTKTAAIPHGVGSVWCTMLWDMTWKLIDIYGLGTDIYDSDFNNAGTPSNPTTFGGQNLSLQLVIEALKLQPCQPGFVNARDAIIAADQVLYGGQHKSVIWEAFANRGLGASADQGSTLFVTDNIEAFDLPSLTIDKTVNQLVYADGSEVSYDILITADCEDQDNIQVTDILDPVFTISSVVCPSPATYSSVANTITINHPGLPAENSFNCTVTVSLDTGITGGFQNVMEDDAESGSSQWTIDNFGGVSNGEWLIVNTASQSPGNSWFVSSTDGPDKTTALQSQTLSLGNFPALSFYHQYDTEESWDGGYIEIKRTIDNNWTKISASDFVQNGYNGVLGSSSNNNIANEEGWTGNSGGFIFTIVKLSQWSNENVMIRFVYGQDDNTNGIGWWIDDISVDNGYMSVLNTACVNSNQTVSDKCGSAEILIRLNEGCSLTGMPCDDFDNCTTGESYDLACNCTNGVFQDSDNDGVCDNEDVCAGFDDSLIGSPCNDGDICTDGETYDNSCNCTNGVFQDADNDQICDANDNECSTIHFDDFESGSGDWFDGGEDADLVTSTNSPSGNASFLIRDNSFENSSITSSILDLTTAGKLEITFMFNAIGMEVGKSFFLEISIDGGANFSVVKEWISGTDFNNMTVYNETVDLSSETVSTMNVFRFRCNGTINADEIYLDNILLDSCPGCQDYVVDYSNMIVPASVQAELNVSSNGIINTNTNIEFHAGQSVNMTAGFEVKLQAVYHAFIEGCSN